MKLKKLIFCLKLNLRKLILFLAIFSIAILFIASLFVNYSIQKKELLDTSLSVNMEYATKIAQKTDSQIQTVLKQLNYSATLLGDSFNDEQFKQSEVDRLKFQSNYFDSVIISDKYGHVLNYSPSKIAINKNVVNTTLGFKQSIEMQNTVITSPYYSIKNNLIVFISQPIFDKNKKYLGFIGGAIYLKEKKTDEKELKSLIAETQKILDKAKNKKIIHQNKSARKKRQLYKKLNVLSGSEETNKTKTNI